LNKYGVLTFRGYFMNFSEARDPSRIIFQILGASLRNYGLRVNFKETEGPLCKIPKIIDFWIYSRNEKFMDWVHGSWTGGAPGSTVDRSGTSTEAFAAHGRCTARRARGLTGGAGEGEQGRARPGEGSPTVDRQRTRVHGRLERRKHRGRGGAWLAHSALGMGAHRRGGRG
jgi:hypothetical protein